MSHGAVGVARAVARTATLGVTLPDSLPLHAAP